MPLKSLICPNGDNVSFDYCLSQCNNRCVPYPIAYAIIDKEINSFHVGNKITVTSIIGCIRKTYLERTTEYANTFANLWFSFRGTALHNSLEVLHGDFRWIIEERFVGTIADIELSGQIDAYDKINKHLIDYKTSKDKSIDYILENGAKKDHILQASIYSMLMKQRNLYVDKVTISYLTMEGIYPCDNVMTYSDDTVLEHVNTYGSALKLAFDNGIPPDKPERPPTYLCLGYCPVYERCNKC